MRDRHGTLAAVRVPMVFDSYRKDNRTFIEDNTRALQLYSQKDDIIVFTVEKVRDRQDSQSGFSRHY